MRNLAAPFALALLCACAGYTTGSVVGGGGDAAIGNDIDAGDAGDAGDSGVDDAGPDAGCVFRSLNGVGAIDNCAGTSTATADLLVTAPDAGQACFVTINLNTATTPCTGVASQGTLDAFDGGCVGFSRCTAPSLPGTLTCITSTGTCTIRICDAGVCGP
jgi:hypothetical protein